MLKFFSQPLMREAISGSGDDAGFLLENELADSARVYFELCREDRQYGAFLIGLARMQDDEIARKAAGDAAGIMMSLVLAGLPAWSGEVIRACRTGFCQAFPENAGLLEEKISHFKPSVRQAVLDIAGRPAASG